MRRILVIEDDPIERESLVDILREEGYEVEGVGSGGEALSLLKDGEFDLALLDNRLPDMEGIEILKTIKKILPSVEFIVITAYGTIEDAVRAMKMGAFHYITKPVNMEELLLLIERAIKRKELEEEIEFLKEEVGKFWSTESIVAESEAMKNILALARRVAPSPISVLLTGESGTGKELLARLIHKLSGRGGRFVAISCGAIPENLLESELFGYEKGAFTGATRAKPGKFEVAHGGTVFLDEVGELPPSLQVKLLRVLEEREIERLGSNTPRKVDIRIISATNRDLKSMVEKGDFREDLYFRLNVVEIRIPPLRERREDILPLAEHFLNKWSKELGKPIKGFSHGAKKKLLLYDWPGNVRELQNIVERAVVLTRGDTIREEDIPIDVKGEEFSFRLEDIERRYIMIALKETGWNIKKAAELLGIHRNTLHLKMKKYGIEKPEQK